MESVAFWAAVAALWLFFYLTTPAQRRELLRSMWTLLVLAGAAGLLWQLTR